jgi:death-on-curing protein
VTEPVWLSRQAVLLLHAEGLAEHGGLDGVRDAGLLDSALARPRNRFAYDGETDPCRLAAAYAVGIARNHPFADGNKRAAFVAAVTFLHLNGQVVDAPEGEAVAAMLDLAAGDLPEEGFAAWLRDNTRPRGD